MTAHRIRPQRPLHTHRYVDPLGGSARRQFSDVRGTQGVGDAEACGRKSGCAGQLSMTAAQECVATRRPTACAADTLRSGAGWADAPGRWSGQARPILRRGGGQGAAISCGGVQGFAELRTRHRERMGDVRSSRWGGGGAWVVHISVLPGVCRERCPATASLLYDASLSVAWVACVCNGCRGESLEPSAAARSSRS